MTYTQHVVDCRDHKGCTAVVCEGTEGVVWVSHEAAGVDPAARINPTVPALDKRGQQDISAPGKRLAAIPK